MPQHPHPQKRLHQALPHLLSKALTKARPVFFKLSFLKFSQFFLALFIIFFPFGIKTLVYSGLYYESGNLNPYTTFFIYFSDLLLLASFFCWGVSFWQKENQPTDQTTQPACCNRPFNYGENKITLFLLIFLGILIFDIFIAENKILHLLLTFRFVELFLFYLLIVNKVLTPAKIIFYFLATMAFQSVTAIFQYLIQSSIGLNILGEPIMNSITPGAAKIDLANIADLPGITNFTNLAGEKILRVFGTFPHANILGGGLFIAIALCFLINPLNKNAAKITHQNSLKIIKFYHWLKISLLFLLSVALLLTFSRSAFFGLLVFLLLYIFISNKKIPARPILLISSILLFFIVVFRLDTIILHRLLFENTTAMQERSLYLAISMSMLIAHPFGSGLGGFTLNMQNYTAQKLTPWLFQPVHNIFLLIANEGGIQALVIFTAMIVYIFYKLIKLNTMRSQPFELPDENTLKEQNALYLGLIAGIIIIGFFDHYFISLYPGQIMLFICLGLLSVHLEDAEKNSAFPLKKTSINIEALPSS